MLTANWASPAILFVVSLEDVVWMVEKLEKPPRNVASMSNVSRWFKYNVIGRSAALN